MSTEEIKIEAPVWVFPWRPGDDPYFLISREWLVTNGLGGYASGSLLGIPTRRYHGIFVPNLPAPRGRTMILPRLDEELVLASRKVLLGGAQLADDRIEGESHLFLKEFRHEWQTPTWIFEIDGHLLEKRIYMPSLQNTVYVDYRLIRGGPIRLNLRPFVTFRGHDGPLGSPPDWPFTLTATHGRYEIRPCEEATPLKLALRPQRGAFVAEERISRAILYQVERNRGQDHLEDLFSPGYLTVELAEGQSIALVASTEAWELLDLEAPAIFEAEQRRLQKLLSLAPSVAQHSVAAQLVLAADQFIILPGSRLEEDILARASGDEARTMIAGYHWFTDWGRDTMISLEGLTLATGRHREAGAILRTFGHYVNEGLLPNHFPEGQRTAIYNTVDATFWYFHALDRYYQLTQDRETLKVLYPVFKSIIEHHVKGTLFGIGVDPADGLIRQGAEGYALTWMDAKVDGWVVTPRRGKPVEVQALWYNALRLAAAWGEELGEPSVEFIERATQAYHSFNDRFWFEEGKYLYDVVDGEEGEGGKDTRLRPNQIFAISLRFPILHERFWRPVVDIVSERLLTPVGLRSLDPHHQDYKPRYDGDLRARDAAYHQGTVWAWLIGHYFDAWQRVYGDGETARNLLRGFESHLREAGVGTISEIFDAEPPYTARGCIAQAWSVAEVLRVLLKAESSGHRR
jgi:predicted glycogen debranching enzyme